jgi:hypothetical protein
VLRQYGCHFLEAGEMRFNRRTDAEIFSPDLVSAFQRDAKRFCDIAGSQAGLLLVTPLERHAKAYSPGPDDTALLSDRAIKQFEAARQGTLPADFETGAAGRIIHDVAIDGRRFWTDQNLGRAAHLSRRANPFVESRMCHVTPLKWTARVDCPFKSWLRPNAAIRADAASVSVIRCNHVNSA